MVELSWTMQGVGLVMGGADFQGTRINRARATRVGVPCFTGGEEGMSIVVWMEYCKAKAVSG